MMNLFFSKSHISWSQFDASVVGKKVFCKKVIFSERVNSKPTIVEFVAVGIIFVQPCVVVSIEVSLSTITDGGVEFLIKAGAVVG